ncbi:9455_t:CDS:2, partial [Entrophospora sp. SA101]
YHITGLFGSLSLTKKTLNRLSKVIVIVSNDQSSSMTTSDDSEYYEEEDVESDNNKGAQRPLEHNDKENKYMGSNDPKISSF